MQPPSEMTKVYPDTAEGAKQCLRDQLEPKLNFEQAQVYPDRWVAGVWAIKGLRMGDYVTDYLVYMAGYPDPLGGDRMFNDCEEVELK